MINAILDVLFPDGGHGGLHQRFVAVLSQAHHLLGSEHLEFLFQLAEDQLYGIVIRSVADIEDIPKSQPLHFIEALL